MDHLMLSRILQGLSLNMLEPTLSLSMLNLAAYPEAALDVTIRN